MESIDSDSTPLLTTTKEEGDDTISTKAENNDDANCDACEKWYAINRFMIPAKLSYFFTVSRREIDTYFVLFFMSLGFNTSDAGLLSGLQYIGGMLGASGWSYVADKYRIHQKLVVFLGVMAMVTSSILPILGIPFGDRNIFKCPNKFKMTADDEYSNSYYGSKRYLILFYSVLITAIIAKSFDASVASFIDTGCLYRVKSSPTKTDYGGQRWVGSLGVGFGGLAYSLSMSLFRFQNISCESGIFIVYALVIIALNVCAYWLFNGVELKETEYSDKNLNHELISTLKNIDNIFFLVCVLFGGIIQGLYFNFLFVRLKELHALPIVFGLQTCVAAVSGAVAYYASNKIIVFTKGPRYAMALSSIAWALRFLLVSFIENPNYIFLIEIIHGFTYSLFITSAFDHAVAISDPIIMTTMCGILNGLYIEFGSLTSNILGGSLYHLYGGRAMFVICSVASLVGGLVMLFYELFKYMIVRGRKK